jgi:ribonuclease HI
MQKIDSFMNTPEMVIYSDASEKKKNLGAAAVILDCHNKVKRSWQASIGLRKHWSVHAAELIAIYHAVEIARSEHMENGSTLDRTFTIASDSKSALQAIANPSNRPRQQIVHKILNAVEDLRTKGVALRLLWIPAHTGIPGGDAADKLAKEAVGPEEKHLFRHLLSVRKKENKERIAKEWQKEWSSTEKGKHLRTIDSGLPSKHTQKLYGPRQRNRAYILTQLRTGHSWLATHARIFGFSEEDKCECGARETVVHVLVDCPKLREIRQQLREKIGEAFNSIAEMLGGKPQGGAKGWTINNSVVDAVLDFAEASKRFTSRAPERPLNRVRSQRDQHRLSRG